MVRLVRHRHTKGPATDRPHLHHRATSRLHQCEVLLHISEYATFSGLGKDQARTADLLNHNGAIGVLLMISSLLVLLEAGIALVNAVL